MDLEKSSKNLSYFSSILSVILFLGSYFSLNILDQDSIFVLYSLVGSFIFIILVAALRFSKYKLSKVYITLVVVFLWFSSILSFVDGYGIDIIPVLLFNIPLTVYSYHITINHDKAGSTLKFKRTERDNVYKGQSLFLLLMVALIGVLVTEVSVRSILICERELIFCIYIFFAQIIGGMVFSVGVGLIAGLFYFIWKKIKSMPIYLWEFTRFVLLVSLLVSIIALLGTKYT
ncbi:hypothetical protein IPM62_04060 [Candidatus Woesebacteria bacterium]|nr:MAG: hypothetical protein IPM62_04060 [Candidatus Woesebacteria bacterium]